MFRDFGGNMKFTFMRLCLPVLFLAAFLTPAFISAPPAGAVPPVTSNLRSDGATAVYSYTYYQDTTLYAVDLSNGTSRSIATDASYPDVSGNRVVWQQGFTTPTRLGGVDLSSGDALTLPAPQGEQMKPAISGSQLVWVNHDASNAMSPWTIQTENLASGDAPTVVATLPSGISDVGQPRIVGERILWSIQFGYAGADGYSWQLWTTNVGGQPTQIAAGSGMDFLSGFDVGGNLAVYAAGGKVHTVGLSAGGADNVIGNGDSPSTDGRYVIWSAAPVSTYQNMLGYDSQTDSHFVAVADGQQNRSPRTVAGKVVWLSAPPYEFSYMVQSKSVSDLLPSAGQPDPGKTSSDWFYFPETQHYLSFGFKNFWVKSGGLAVFGYPLTEEFTQGGYTVQYLERQRFEYHPEFAGTPYETELGLLGSEAASAAGLKGTAPFIALPAGTTSDSNCTFVSATGHRLCGGFRQYWQSHGLDFGDVGSSYRESLTLFGYPISEEFTDPTSGLTVQYFERAVFEYHPNNPNPYKVELRLLGSQRLQAFGW